MKSTKRYEMIFVFFVFFVVEKIDVMDDTLLFIPPCCVDKKLPRAVMQAPGRFLTFYTHGDVTMEKFYRAVSYMVVDPHVMVLSMPTVENETLVFLSQCFERGWITHLVLTSNNDATALVKKYLAEYADRILYTASNDATYVASHMVLYNKEQALTLSGPMYARFVSNELSSYTLHYMPRHMFTTSNKVDWGNTLRNLMFPDALRHRQAVHLAKRKMKPGVLNRFIHLDFPPYKEDDE